MLGLEGRPEERPERPPEPAVERLDPVDAAIGVITAPALSMRAIALARAWPIGLAIYIAIAVLNGFAGLTGRRQVPPVADPEVSRAFQAYFDAVQSPLGVLLNAVLFTPLLLVIGTGILYLVARLLGGQGSYGGLLATQAFTAVPSFLLAPLTLLANILRVPVLGGLFSLVFGIWTLVLAVIGIREGMALSTGRAVATLLIPIGVLVLLACVLIFVVVALIAGSLANR
jgi:hypothetical protein